MSTETPGSTSAPTNAAGATPAPVERIGPYRLVKFLGEGGMGKVHLAHHDVLARDCALKFMPDDVARQPGWVERFKTEARMLAKLDHPGIVRVYGAVADTDAGRFYLEMEYIDGGDLEGRIRETRTGLAEDEVKRIVGEVLQALEYAHGMRVIHRDLKPANILIRSDGAVKISDFGLAMVVGEDYHRSLIQKSITLSQLVSSETVEVSSASMLSAVGGTLPFMSPQTKRGEAPDLRDDLFAVGVIVYNMLTGQLPEIDGAPLRSLRPQVSKDWDAFFRRCIASQREDRFQTATEAREALARVGAKRHPKGLIAGVAAALFLGAAGLAAWQLDLGKALLPASVAKAAQEIRFAAPAATGFADEPVALVATTSSGLPVRFEVVGGPGRIEGGLLHFLQPGSVVVRADQPGNDFVAPAVAVERTFAAVARPADPLAQTIEFPPLPDRTSNDTPFDLIGSASSGLPVAFTVVSGPARVDGARLTLTGTGTVVVRAVQEGNGAFAPATAVERSFVVAPYVEPEINLALPGGAAMVLKLVPAGEARLGADANEIGHSTNDSRSELFAVAQPFYAGATEVTQAQYRAIAGTNPSHNRFKGENLPVEQVRYADLVGPDGFLARMNAWLRENGFGRFEAVLPTEQEWEYACRAGTSSSLNSGSWATNAVRDAALDRLAIYNTNSTAPVATKQPNAWGLFDMHGNVAEWTAEGHLRGGSFRDTAASCRSASRLRDQRGKTAPDERFGFRIVLKPAAP